MPDVTPSYRQSSARPGRRKHPWYFKLVLAFGSVAVALLLLEGCLRVLIEPVPSLKKFRENSLSYRVAVTARHFLEPGQQMVDEGKGLRFTIHEHGYRGTPFAAAKSSDTLRVIFVGGSQVFSINTTDGADWPTRVGDYLTSAGLRAESINAGIPGHASFDAVGRVYTELWNYQPDYLVLCNLWNDFKYMPYLDWDSTLLRVHPVYHTTEDPRLYYQNGLDEWFGRRSQVYMRMRNAWMHLKFDQSVEQIGQFNAEAKVPEGQFNESGLEQYRMNLRMFADAARNAGARPVFMLQPTLAVEGMSDAAREAIEFEKARLEPGELVRANRLGREVMREVAAEKHVPLLDPTAIDGDTALFKDHVHTRPEGDQRLAELLGRQLVEVIAQDQFTSTSHQSQ